MVNNPPVFNNQICQRLATLLTRSASQTVSDNLSTRSDKMDSLIIIDRRVDMVTPLLTQLTYEGLIDEMIGVKNCAPLTLSQLHPY